MCIQRSLNSCFAAAEKNGIKMAGKSREEKMDTGSVESNGTSSKDSSCITPSDERSNEEVKTAKTRASYDAKQTLRVILFCTILEDGKKSGVLNVEFKREQQESFVEKIISRGPVTLHLQTQHGKKSNKR